MIDIRIIFLGTSAAIPTNQRGLSSIAILRKDEVMIFDAGEGMQIKYMCANISVNKKMKIFITHMHGDHCIGILGLLQTLSLMGRKKPIDLYGEPRLVKFIIENIKIIKFGTRFNINVHSIWDEGIVVKEKEYQIKCCKTIHSTESFAYLLEEFERPGIFLVEKARKIGIPEGEMYNKLQHGKNIIFNKKIIYSKELTGPKRKGRKIGISGDTRTSKKIQDFFKGCDLLIFESTYMNKEYKKAVESMHSTSVEVANLAKNASIKKLVLTHFSSRYKDLRYMLMETRKIFRNTCVANDLDTIIVPYIK
ncbi:MAG: ribonuclease Z [Nitrososphaeraceae archaeon]